MGIEIYQLLFLLFDMICFALCINVLNYINRIANVQLS